MGTEDKGLYELSRRFASLCREDSKAVFQHLKYEDGKEFDVPLVWAWGFAVAARNKQIARALIEHKVRYRNPLLFAACDHVIKPKDDIDDDVFNFIKQCLLDAQQMGVQGALLFPWSMKGEFWGLYLCASPDNENFDINHYLEQQRTGYTLLVAKGTTKAEESREYAQIFRMQRI